ncbi:PASTA domain-containing protein [Paenibacillus oceani]|uniref:PASTA domain-containing protein n=1 Tax=Paenibacillus oceani TaxID=2772510 RepID=A0A927C8C0_9BACL|nr:PASTA domain-containing protein [Paenibacillus oceani]MBD2861968.1 PASTA domain-containing protein [Paenibacillus oceani]
MKPFSNRYILERLVTPLQQGTLYIGKDTALKRLVFIYEIPYQGETGKSGAIAGLSKASHGLHQPEFMHVLDVEVGEEQLRAVLNYKEGRPLRDFIQEHPLSFKEAASMVGDFGAALLDAAEQRPLDFSLEAGNLWVTEEMRINVIDTWNAPSFKDRLVKHLSGLLYQLVVGSLVVPAEAGTFSAQLRQAMRHVPSSVKETAITALTEGWQENITAADLVRIVSDMRPEIVHGDNRSGDPLAPPLPSRKEPRSPSDDHERRYEAVPDEDPNDDLQAEADEAEADEAVSDGRKGRLFRISKSLWIGGAFALVGVAVFVGVFTLLLGITGNKGEEAPSVATPDQPAQQKQGPTEVPKKDQPAPDPVKPPVTPAPGSGSGDVVDIPTLTGLAREDAEKLALAYGLKYEYFIEFGTQAAGTVIRQDPVPSKKVEKGSKVTFWVSKGPPSP